MMMIIRTSIYPLIPTIIHRIIRTSIYPLIPTTIPMIIRLLKLINTPTIILINTHLPVHSPLTLTSPPEQMALL